MSNEVLLTALREALSEADRERKKRSGEVDECQSEMNRRKTSLEEAEKEEKCAEHDLHSVQQKLRALTDLYNESTEKPEALRPHMDKLSGDQARASEKSKVARERAQDRRQFFQDAQTRLAVAQQAYVTVQAQWQQISDLIQKEANK